MIYLFTYSRKTSDDDIDQILDDLKVEPLVGMI